MNLNEEPKTKEDIKNMLKHLDDEYRKANISETTYKELKERYKSQMSYIENTINPNEAQPEEPLQTVEEPKKKAGLFGRFKKKEEKKEEAAAPQPAATSAEVTISEDPEEKEVKKSSDETAKAVNNLSIELEKLKVMLEAMRDQKKGTDESIQSLFESIGEVRSMSIQNDSAGREMTSKMDRLEDDINNLKPKEIEKRFSSINETLEKYQLTLEKLQSKSDDMSEKLIKMTDSVKAIGNTETLAGLNQNVQKKLDDIREASNYVERLASKAEKIFIDLKMQLDDMVVLRSKQEALEDAIKDMLKTLDAINIKFENYPTKKDMEEEKQDILILGKEQESIKNVMAIAQTNVPEPILTLRKEREDIKLFMDSLEEQMKLGKIRAVDYENTKKKNSENLKEINESITREWKKFEQMLKNAPPAPQVSLVDIKNEPAEEGEKGEYMNRVEEKREREEEITGEEAGAQQEETQAADQTHDEETAPREPQAIQNAGETVKEQQNPETVAPIQKNPETAAEVPKENKPAETTKERRKKIIVDAPF
jgi:hypothetical protein